MRMFPCSKASVHMGGGGGKGCSRERKGGGWMGIVIGTYGERRVNSRDDVCSADLEGSGPWRVPNLLGEFLIFGGSCCSCSGNNPSRDSWVKLPCRADMSRKQHAAGDISISIPFSS